MLRMMLLGFLIPLGVGVLAAMELKTPARSAAVPVPPVAEIAAGVSQPRGVLAKADRFEVAAASIERPARPALVDERNSSPEGTSVGASEPPRTMNPHRHDPKPKKVTAVPSPKSNPKKAELKRTTTTERRKAAGNAEPCRLGAFGGLLKALGSADCEF